MRSINPFNDNYPLSIFKRIFHLTLNFFLSISLIWLYFNHFYLTPSPTQLIHSTTISSISSSPPSNSSIGKDKTYAYKNSSCDYSNGDWISDMRGPIYNATTCGIIKESENCITNGKPNLDYLYWRWKPNECNLPRFEPNTFLKLIKNKHIAFVGDSLARNQLESLLCMLSTFSTPNLIYQYGKDDKFRMWNFPSHNANFSFYWSPFLVHGVERTNEGNYYNTMFLDIVNEIWARDIDQMDMIVISTGRWFLLPSIYYENNLVIGSLNCPKLNHTQMDFYGPLRKALRTTLNSIIERKVSKGKAIDVILKTFSPDHFEGDWDKNGTCSKTKPYRKGEKVLGGMETEIRKIEIEEVESAKKKVKKFEGIRFEVMDITKLALLRPDGHPGPYMNPFPFANGVSKYVQSDCVHWCLPGPVDTWNEIFLDIMKKWED